MPVPDAPRDEKLSVWPWCSMTSVPPDWVTGAGQVGGIAAGSR